MEVQIGEVASTVRTADGAGLLAPEVLRAVVAAVRAQLRDEQDHARRVADERRLTAGAGGGEP